MSKRAFIFLLLVLASVMVIWQLFWPAYLSVSESRAQVALWESSLDDTENLSKKLQLLKTKFESMDKETQLIADALPKEEEIPSLLVQLEALSSRNGLILNSVNFIKEEKKTGATQASTLPAGAKSLTLEVSMSGSYASLKNFLKSAESSLRLMDVSRVVFGQEGTGALIPGGLMNSIVDLTVYYR